MASLPLCVRYMEEPRAPGAPVLPTISSFLRRFSSAETWGILRLVCRDIWATVKSERNRAERTLLRWSPRILRGMASEFDGTVSTINDTHCQSYRILPHIYSIKMLFLLYYVTYFQSKITCYHCNGRIKYSRSSLFLQLDVTKIQTRPRSVILWSIVLCHNAEADGY